MADVKITALSAMGALDGTEVFPGVQSATTKKETLANITAYVIDTITDLAPTAPASGYELMGTLADGTPKMFDLDALGDYIGDYLANGVSAVTPVVTDHVMLNDGGVLEKVLLSTFNTKMLDGTTDASATLKTSIRDISGETDRGGSVDGTEHMLLCVAADPQRATLAQVAAYVHGEFDTYLNGLTTVTIADADLLYVYDAGTGKKIAASALATYVEGKVSSNICADVCLEDVGVRKTATASAIYDYIVAEFASQASATTPVVDAYKFLFFNGTTLSTATATVLASYVITEGVVNAAAVGAAAVATDKVVINQGGTVKTVTAANLATYILDGSTAPSDTLQEAIFDLTNSANITAVGTAAGTELLMLDDAGTAKKETLDDLASFVHNDATAGFGGWIAGIADGGPTLADADFFYVNQSGADKTLDVEDLRDFVIGKAFDEADSTDVQATDLFVIERSGTVYRAAASYINTYVQDALEAIYDPNWDLLDTGDYTATPADADTITMQDPTLSTLSVGQPIKFSCDSGVTYYYAIISAVGVGSIDIRGASLTAPGTDITHLYAAPPSRVITKEIKIPGSYLVPWAVPDGGTTKDILQDIGRQFIEWGLGDAYLVSMGATQGTVDGVAQPKINCKLAGSAVLTEDTNKGIQVSGVAGTWTRNSSVGINTANYKIEDGEAIEILCTAAGTEDGEASDLSIVLVFVLE
jgi:hypothetical protein